MLLTSLAVVAVALHSLFERILEAWGTDRPYDLDLGCCAPCMRNPALRMHYALYAQAPQSLQV